MPGHDADETRDDVLLLLTDQERYDLTAPGGLPVETAALDSLAADGVRFTRAYTPISICSSARASLLTGQYPHEHGVINNVHEADAVRTDLSPERRTFGPLLREVGYENSYIGKWHVGREVAPEDFGFDFFGTERGEYDDRLEAGLRAYREGMGIDPDGIELEDPIYSYSGEDRYLIGGRTPVPPEATRPYYIAERTIERLEDAAGSEGRFFHRSDFRGPHHPYVVPEPYASMYDPAGLDPWPTDLETFDGKPRVQERYVEYRGVEGLDREDWAELRALYMGIMHLIDDQIGRILDAVAELGLYEDTLVVHSTDHGDFTGGHRQFNKGPLMYEDTYHIPLVVGGPSVAGSGRECHELVSLIDLMPTFLDVAGVSVPEDVAGRSLCPLLEGREWDPREAVFAEYHGDEMGFYSQRMVRTDRYKYVFNAPDVDELYDLEADPHELQNLVDHPDYRAVRDRLRRLLTEWMAERSDPIHRWSRKHLGRG
jgi:arylsulfatase A-like enzyme